MTSAATSLSSLLRQASIDDHEELLRAADATLQANKSDLEAQHVKVVALLKLDRFDDALRTVESGGDKLKDKARLEWAYALYKAGEPGRAAEVARQGADRGMKHVEAQSSYRSEDFRNAAELYKALASERGQVVNESVDLRINSGAVDAQLEWASQGHLVHKKKPEREDLEAFETAYNAACGSIARGELGQAEILLKRSKDLCNALEDMSEADKQAELLPISVQQVYVLTKLGRLADAHKLASSVNAAEIPDLTSKHIARVNAVATSSTTTNPFLVHRLVQQPVAPSTADKPFGYQQAALRRNEFAVNLLSQKYAGTAESTAAVIASQSAPTLDATINCFAAVNAAAQARNRTGKDALKVILPALEKRPNDVGLLLVVIQLYVVTGNHDSAITLLETFFNKLSQSSSTSDLDVRYAPGLIGTLVSLYSARNQSNHVRTELAKAAKYWRHKSKDSAESRTPRSITNLLKAAGSVLLESTNPDDLSLASDIFSDLHAQDASDRYTSAGLIASLASTAPSSITAEQLSSLTPVQRLIASTDVSALSTAGVAKPSPSSTPATSLKRAAATPAAPRKAKKIRAGRKPKDFDPAKTMDPERWLPLKDRSSYRPKGRKGKQRQAMLMQGGPVAEERDASVSRPGTPAAQVEKAKGAPLKKKKGKGGKW